MLYRRVCRTDSKDQSSVSGGEGAVTRASVSINLGPRYCSWYLYRHDEYLYSIAVTRHLARIPSFSVSTSLKQHKQMCTYNLLNGYIYLLCWQLSIWLCSFVQTTVNAILSTIYLFIYELLLVAGRRVSWYLSRDKVMPQRTRELVCSTNLSKPQTRAQSQYLYW